ncbi:TPA: helix-turn-helix transcriptional regulator [Listeria monocytogenes]|nr:XRE family transcriptional regulator [Listeria monocytogenes]EAD0739972.1 XRE family transcriptional regulator [Listeria monocytogenes]EAD9140333.1 XRE family transcriptional regulator [Listeria monocytogenes]EIL9239400.1 helix-turn-helix transcriptional regulator [Listeria monocytogenes]EJC6459523.1 helix-turn-helix transcriptional regulator [Listeria monocytogenes]
MIKEHIEFKMAVKRKMYELNINQKQLAKLLNITDVYLSDILNGRRQASDKRRMIIKILELDIE